MPIYEFQATDGTKVERFFSAKNAPDLGKTIRFGGKTYRRIMSTPQISADVKNVVHKYPYVSRSLPRHMPGAQHTKEGMPIIRSRQHEREVGAQQGLKRD